MWEKETCYHFALKKNLIFDFCQNAYKDNSSESFDMVFITKDKSKIPVHRVIFALFSGIFKELDFPVEMLVVHLPDFTANVVDCLIQFLYSGSVVLHSTLRDDFISLCNDLKIRFPEDVLEIPPVTVEPPPIKVEDDKDMIVEEYGVTDPPEYNIQEEDESFDEPEDGSSSNLNYSYEDTASRSGQPLHNQSEIKSKSRHLKLIHNSSPNSTMPHANIQEALADIANGLNTMEAARRYGIPKTTLYRWAKKRK